jgi:drug/metabolite transporter (DMT)-like permease
MTPTCHTPQRHETPPCNDEAVTSTLAPTRTLAIWGPLITLWFVWGSTYLGIAVVIQSMPGLLANGGRFLVAGTVLAILVTMTQGARTLRIPLPQLAYSALMGVMLLGVGIGTLSIAQQYVPTGIAALLVAVIPLWIVILRFAARDRPSTLTQIGVVVGFAGIALMMLPGGTVPVSGDDADVVLASLAILTSAFIWAFFSYRSTSFQLPKNAAVMTVYELLAAGMALVGIGALRGERWEPSTYTASSWWGFAFLVVASIVGFTAYSWLLSRAPMSLLSTYAYVNPVVAVLLGSLILSEVITRDVVIGLTVIVGGVALVVAGERRRPLRT